MFPVLLLVILLAQTSLTQNPASESADIVLLVDSSDALGRRSFLSVKSFINKIISQFPIGPNKYRVALVQYSDDVYTEFHLDSFKAKNPMLNHIKKNLAFRGGSLRTGNAIQKVHETFFKTPSKDKHQILVVSTSGLSVDDVRRPAKILQDEGIKVIALGTKAATQEELQAMAPQSFYYYFATPKELLGFSSVLSGTIETIIQGNSTSDIPTTVPPSIAPQEPVYCRDDLVADVVFVVDESVSDTNANYITGFLENTIKQLPVEEQCTNIGLVTYSTKPEQKTFLNTNTTESDALKVIQHFSPKEGQAHLGAALNFTRKKLFTEAYGSRKTQGVQQFVTIITHRASDDSLTEAAELLQQTGVNVFAIGIEGANITQLTQVVSYPPERNVISKINFSGLPKESKTLKKKLVNQIQDVLYVQAKREEKLEAGCMDTEKADIYFLIDGSTSIGPTNFNDMKIFMQKVVQTFIIGPDNVRFGVVQYSTNYETEFELDVHTKRSSLEKAINNIKQLGGNTYTGAAINSMQPLFEKARKQRGSSVPCYLIVLTDGQAHDNVLVPARKLRSEMVKIYAIGVKNANKTQLNEIAGSESRVYFVQSFAALENIKENLVQHICYEKVCKGMKADIMFLVDSSSSIGPENFEKMKNFMKELVKKSDIGPERVQIGVVQFSDVHKEEFPLHRHSTKSDINNAIGRMVLMDRNTLTGAALKVISNYFEPTKGARESVNKILILITDGRAQDEVAAPAAALREKGIIIYAVGVFNALREQLEVISGTQDKVFYVEKFDVLHHIQDDILFATCIPPEECKRIELLDVVFVIDSSGSIGDNYEIMKNFMISIVNKSDVGPDNVQFGALKYSDNPNILFHLDTHSTKTAVIKAIQRDTLLGGNTYTAKALQHSAALFTEAHGSRKRKGVPQVLMVITDGDSHDSSDLDRVSKSLRDTGITIYAIGVKGAKPAELRTMAASEENMFYVDEFDGLKDISKNLSTKFCIDSNPECDIQAEVVFLIDGSKSVPYNDFLMMKNFLKELIKKFEYKSELQFGMAQFSERYKEEFSLGDYLSKEELMDKINNVTMLFGKRTYIGVALTGVQDLYKSRRRRSATSAVEQKLLLITDGKSDDGVAKPAEVLRKQGVGIYAIGVGEVNEMQLQQITGSPDRKYTVDVFSDLPKVTKQLTRDWCKKRPGVRCLVDIVLAFDISSQKSGEYLFERQHRLDHSLLGILKYLTDFKLLSCDKETKTQLSVAIAIENSNQPISPKLQVHPEKILNELRKVVVNNPSHLNVEFLDKIWQKVQDKSKDSNRKKVLLLFSDGPDDEIEALKQKSGELRRKGLAGLITVALEGATNFNKLMLIEFGKGFGYNYQLTIGMQNIADRIFEFMAGIAERECCCELCMCWGTEGPMGFPGPNGRQGIPGTPGNQGHQGEDGEPGERGIIGPKGKQGVTGCQGEPGMKGLRGVTGEKGEDGTDGIDGINGEEGSHGLPGEKGEKGDSGQMGSSGTKGLPGDIGAKGIYGNAGEPGMNSTIKGTPGLKGMPGKKGERGSLGRPGFVGSKGNTGARGLRGPPGLQGLKGTPGPGGRKGEEGFRGLQGSKGANGDKGEKGNAGSQGLQGNFGVKGSSGNLGKPGTTGSIGEPGDPGDIGPTGPTGHWGLRGREGTPKYGRPGKKGLKGQEGCMGDTGLQGDSGDMGDPGAPGPKGHRGRMGYPGQQGRKGDPGVWGDPGRLGLKGEKGQPEYSHCQLIEYIRNKTCCKSFPKCPLYPTELVFALDLSQDTTAQTFERMREIVIAIVNNTRTRESNCPVGARVAVVSYNSDTHYLIRFSDFQSKKRLIKELNALSYQRSASGRDLGGSMRFVARNVFKRTIPGVNVRRVAVFFSNGQSDNPSSIDTAVLEFTALDIHPAVIAFRNTPHVNRAFAMDNSRLFQVINLQQERDYAPSMERLLSCVLCYDKCDRDESCFRRGTSPPQAYMDAAFILESSRRISPAEFKQLKDFLGAAIDNFDIPAKPDTSLEGDRVAVVSHTPLNFRPQTHMHPAKIEFDFVAFRSKGRMKRHIQESLQPLNGSAAIGHAIQWTISNVFSVARNKRELKAIFVISAGKTSQWDKGVLRDASLRAKCQGYAFFVLSLGHEYDHLELEQLASFPLEQHLLQLGRNHKAELGYAVNFLKPFVRLLKGKINHYPPTELKRKCAEILTTKPLYTTKIDIPAIEEALSGDYALDAESGFLEAWPIH